MEKFELNFIHFVRDKKLLGGNDKILLAVSGGMDSVVMTDLFSKMKSECGIAHCNFSLRGKESDGDEEFVKSLAKKYGFRFHSRKFDTKKIAREKKLSTQEAARMIRYQWFGEIAEKYVYKKIATAHHLDDSIETFFINLSRGTGMSGLRGIPLINGRIIRPLLFASRSEIEEYAKRNKIKHREDSSNESDDYLRNRIRHHVIPQLRENSPGFNSHMERLMCEFSVAHGMVQSSLDDWKKKFVQRKNSDIHVPLKKILEETDPAAFLSLLLHSFGISGIDCGKVLAVETPGKVFHAKEYSILRDRSSLILRKGKEEQAELTISSLPAEIVTDDRVVSIRTDVENETAASAAKKNIYWIDGDKIRLPLTLRTWKPGDYFVPLGMKGKKKISDFFTDQKINRFDKDKILLLLSGNDIVCILGHRIDERFKITASTKKIIAIELSQR